MILDLLNKYESLAYSSENTNELKKVVKHIYNNDLIDDIDFREFIDNVIIPIIRNKFGYDKEILNMETILLENY